MSEPVSFCHIAVFVISLLIISNPVDKDINNDCYVKPTKVLALIISTKVGAGLLVYCSLPVLIG